MPQVRERHGWNVSGTEARHIQDEMRALVDLRDVVSVGGIRQVAGIDNGYSREGDAWIAYAAVVVVTLPDLTVSAESYAAVPVTFPYIPGLLTFREAPAIVAAYRDLDANPDVIMFDGQGYAHPRRIGIASHLGVLFGKPSIGVAKSRLVGRYDEPAQEFGAWTPVSDRGEVVGAAVRTKVGHSPLFVSPGHLITLEPALQIVLACTRPNTFLPEPTGLAHRMVAEYKARVKADQAGALR
ncbi:MAG TPA: endonuclease V [Chloroflexota bacterium]|nr:endonuclease V [Chloroflexota bacterium]